MMNDPEIRDLRALLEFKASLEQSLKEEPRARELSERMWRELAGAQTDEMLASPEKAEKYLRHPSWKLRLAAISILRMVWEPNERLATECEKIAFDDPHVQVRETALFTLACCFEGTNNARIGALLAQIVSDSGSPEGVRKSAYEGLFRLRGLPVSATPLPGKYRFPEDVDWEFVKSFAVE